MSYAYTNSNLPLINAREVNSESSVLIHHSHLEQHSLKNGPRHATPKQQPTEGKRQGGHCRKMILMVFPFSIFMMHSVGAGRVQILQT